MDIHLNGVVACISGDLAHDADHSQWTYENIKRWLEIRGGKIVDVMGDSVTHLLCSVAAYEAKTDKVKYAKSIDCEVVTYEWLDDAILLYDQFKRKAPTHLYHPGKDRPQEDIEALYKKKQPKSTKKGAQTETAASGLSKKNGDGNTREQENEDPAVLENRQPSGPVEVGRKGNGRPTENKYSSLVEQNPKASEDGRRQVARKPHGQPNSGLRHIYRDPQDGFFYNVEICGPDRYGNPRGRRWMLRIFESKAKPKLYEFNRMYCEKNGARHRGVLGNGVDRPKYLAMKEFEDFFFQKTGIKWEERLLKADERQRGKTFRYRAPAPGEPVGYIPSQYMTGKTEDTKGRGQNDDNPVSFDSRESVSSRKRKRDDPVESQQAKALKATKRSGAYDDVSNTRADRL